MNREQRFLIAPSCSGVNFLITSFLMLALVHRASLILSAAIAYATTEAANAVRISIALQLHDAGVTWGPLDPARVHRLEGIVVYFAFLLLIFAIGERLACSSGDAPPRSFPRVLIPLAVYYGVTLRIRIANGALSQGARFGEHALFTLLVSLAMIVAAGAGAHAPRSGPSAGTFRSRRGRAFGRRLR